MEVVSTDPVDTEVTDLPNDSTPAASQKDGTALVSATGEPEVNSESKSKGDKRFDKLTKEKSLAEEERDYWKEQALKGKPEDKTQPAKEVTVAPRPKADDFASHDEFTEALIEWKAEQLVEKKLAKMQEDTKKETTKEKVLSVWQQRQAEARETYSDYDAITGTDEIQVNDIVREVFFDSELGAHLAYWWGSNPEKAAEMLKMSPTKLVRELGKIEDKIESQLNKDQGKTSTEKKGTIKPKPVVPLGEGKSSGNLTKDLYDDSLSFQEFVRLRKQK